MAANLRFLMSSVIVCMIKSSLSIVTARDLNAEDYDDLSQGITNATFLDEEEDETRLWKAHGWLMAAAWGVMVPLAVGASLLRSWLPEGLWFRLHLALNAIVSLRKTGILENENVLRSSTTLPCLRIGHVLCVCWFRYRGACLQRP
jgi:hypothetical protein